jgi:hypothetical protein
MARLHLEEPHPPFPPRPLFYLTTEHVYRRLAQRTGKVGNRVSRKHRYSAKEYYMRMYPSLLNYGLRVVTVIKSGRMRWAGYVVRMAEMKNAYKILVGKNKGKRLLGKLRYRWEDNIRLDFRKVGWEEIHLAQDRD